MNLWKSRLDPSTEALRMLWLFNQCSDRDLVTIRHLSTEISAEPGRVLARSGQFGLELFVFCTGQATVRAPELPDRTFGAGSWFGEVPMLTRCAHASTVVVDEASRILVFQAREFASLLTDVPRVARRLLVDLAVRAQLAEADQRRCARLENVLALDAVDPAPA